MHTNKYRRLSNEEREEISRGLAQGKSLACIARHLERWTSTVSREVDKGRGKMGYRAHGAGYKAKHRVASRRLGKHKLNTPGELRTFVVSKLKLCWSPEEIVASLWKEYPQRKDMRISAEAIYQYIYVLPRGSLKKELVSALRQERSYRRKHSRPKGQSEQKTGKIADMISIEERPVEVASRTIPGHWEGDLIMGKHKKTALGTLVERTTRLTLLVPLKAKDTHSVRLAYARVLRKLPAELAKTLTYDQGKEMSEHKQFTVDTKIKVYFAHPGSPWERGTNENTNGLIRQYFPKGTDFSKVTSSAIRRAQNQLNGRPRKVLNWEKPNEVFNQLVALER